MLGQEFYAGRTIHIVEPPFEESMRLLGDGVVHRPEGYAVDRAYPNTIYVR
jgi:phosphoenolpyruvate carboxykinase (diphosphate)